MLKIFRIAPDNPLIWQLAYTDTEIDKIIANRYADAFGKPKKHKVKNIIQSIHRMKLTNDSIW